MVRRWPLAVAAALVLGTGCNLLLDVDGYQLLDGGSGGGAGAGGGGGGASCQDGSGLGGLSCWACEPATHDQFANQCSASVCTPFARTRLGSLLPDGGLPPLLMPAPPDAGAPGGGPADAGPADAGPADAGPADAGPADAGPVDAGAPDAGVACVSLPSRLVIVGSTAMKPFLARLGSRLGNTSPPITLLYQSVGSCVGVKAMVEDVPAQGTATWWDPTVAESASERTCVLPPGGLTVDVGISDVFATSCGVQSLPANVGDFPGPIQTMALVVPFNSTQSTISAEAAYLVYGLGADAGIAPWTDESVVFQRSASSGTQSLIAAVTLAAPSLWRGTPTRNSDDLLARLLAVPTAKVEGALGILSTDYTDAYRDTLKVLAFQDYGQGCALHPDSTRASLDKANVRSGQYPLWGPVHFLVRTSTQTGAVISPTAAQVVGYLDGSRQLAGLDLVQYYAQRHLIPPCAMRVKRSLPLDGALPRVDLPAQGCGCYFDAVVSGRSDCTPCASALTCPAQAPKCNFGYCER